MNISTITNELKIKKCLNNNDSHNEIIIINYTNDVHSSKYQTVYLN